MVYLILSVFAVLAVLLFSEWGWRRRWFANEVGRKFVHITVGSFVAFWPFFLDWTYIQLLSLAFFAVAIVSMRIKLFKAIHSVQRPTYGEIFFALTVGMLTVVTHNKGIYAAALLQMSLADGFAAIFGNKYGKGNTYRIFDHFKSVVGTGVFVVTSVVILVGYNLLAGGSLSAIEIAAIVGVAALLENITPLGLDNLAVPLFVGWLLTVL